MLDTLYNIDITIFYFINGTLSNSLFDKFFVFITDVKNWYLTYLILLLISFFKGGRIGKIASIFVLFLIIISDQLSSFVLKDFFARIRPCNVLPDVNILVSCTESFSFPSSHAVNNFAVAVFFAKLFPKLKWILYSSAFLIALSRPYCGVHYPSDIVGGAIIGSLLGYLFAIAALKIDSLLKIKSTQLTDKFERIEFK
ncbi:MAG: phosphatase PAP2 family protein [Bacteroidota bacterium]